MCAYFTTLNWTDHKSLGQAYLTYLILYRGTDQSEVALITWKCPSFTSVWTITGSVEKWATQLLTKDKQLIKSITE